MIGAVRPLESWDSRATWRTFAQDQFHQQIEGVELQKAQADLDRYAELIDISQPDLVVECGTRTGGSALWFAEHGLQVISIDINARPRVKNRIGIDWLVGSSTDSSIYGWVLPQLRGKRVMVSLDSDHHAPHVQREIDLWSRVVSAGCYLVVEDGCFDCWDDERGRRGGWQIPEVGGPLWAVGYMQTQLLAFDFWRDEALEGMSSVSHSPGGWWRKHD